jgi:competence ComEA-like helix-hairpin-helix protein
MPARLFRQLVASSRACASGCVTWIFTIALLAVAPTPQAAELEKLTGCQWVDSPANDGDSFIVKSGDRQLHVRLYFVDCPETFVSTDADAKRVRDQARHFGLTDTQKIIDFGKEAAGFTRQTLQQPFTIHTAYADAMGRSRGGRIYAFVTTAGGDDLAALLVQNGWARTFGFRRSPPNGRSSDQEQNHLADLEAGAMLKRSGIWATADPNEITRLRELQRKEDKEISEIRESFNNKASEDRPIDLNTASASELQSISGIGPKLATAIIAGRPYAKVDDLLRVKGIGDKLLSKIRPFVTVAPPAEAHKPNP